MRPEDLLLPACLFLRKRETYMKTYEIAIQLGYKSVQHFSRIFKEYYNYTPMEYRQRRNMQ